MKRVVITGIGAVTPLGNNIEFTWKNLTKKISGIGSITRFDSSELPSRIAGELKKFSPEDYISQKDILRLYPIQNCKLVLYRNKGKENMEIPKIQEGMTNLKIIIKRGEKIRY